MKMRGGKIGHCSHFNGFRLSTEIVGPEIRSSAGEDTRAPAFLDFYIFAPKTGIFAFA